MMTDNELLEELKKRFEINKKALYDLKALTSKLEDVNKKLIESEMLKSHFISNIKNEINNPLTSVLLLAKELAENPTLDSSQITDISKTIYKEIFNLDFQLRNIFAAAELEAGEAVVSPAKVDVQQLFIKTIETFKHKFDEKNLSYAHHFINMEGGFILNTDPEKLQLVLSNLLYFAINHSPSQSVIEVKAWVHDGNLNFCVNDSGEGYTEEEQKFIFQRFSKLYASSPQGFIGHGLGLSVAKSMVELLGGIISLASKKGYGSIFTVFLPQISVINEPDAFAEDGNEFFFEDTTDAGEKF